MSSQTTDTAQAVVPIEPPTETDAQPPSLQDVFMHAMAAAEDAVAVLQVRPPRCLSVTELLDGGYDVSLQFSEAPAYVLEFATAWDVSVTKAPHQSRPGHSYTEAAALVRGVRVTAWTLTRNEPDPEATVETAAPAEQIDPDERIPYNLVEQAAGGEA